MNAVHRKGISKSMQQRQFHGFPSFSLLFTNWYSLLTINIPKQKPAWVML